MIVKNEEKFLNTTLDSVKSIIDELIIIDTGSTDTTLKIAAKYGAQIYSYEWNNDFSEARNFSISKASAEWILVLDGDELIDKNDLRVLLKFLIKHF